MLFVKERKYELMVENPSMPFGKMMQIVAERWRALSDEERVYFQQKAEEDKLRHNKEVDIWNNHIRHNPVPM